jgi:hypothetical protein
MEDRAVSRSAGHHVLYKVRWVIAGRQRKKSFPTKALAESFRSELIAALRNGRPFGTTTGQPFRGKEVAQSESWYASPVRTSI